MATLQDFGLNSSATIGSPEATSFLLGMNPSSPSYATNFTPKEQTVVSSDKSQQIADATKRLAGLNVKGSTLNEDGTQSYADGTVNIDTVRKMQGTYQGMDGNQYYNYDSTPVNSNAPVSPDVLDPTSKNYDPTQDPIYKANIQLINDMKSQFDANSVRQIDSIHQQYDALINEQKASNASVEASRKQSLIMGGGERYAQISSAGVMHSQISYGLQQIADLTSKENSAINAALNAQQEGDFKFMNQQVGLAETARKEKQDAMKKIADDLRTQANKVAEDKRQADKDSAIAQEFQSGTTDPAKILANLKDNGLGITAKDIKDAIDNLNPDGKSVVNIMTEAAKNGAPQAILSSIGSSKNVTDAIKAAGDFMQTATGDLGEYLAYKRDTLAQGKIPIDYNSFVSRRDYAKAYSTAKGTAAGKLAGEGTQPTGNQQTTIKSKDDLPQVLRPYASQSANGTWYVDVSGISSSAREKIISQAGDLPVITNANEALDLVNIRDVSGKLTTIGNIMKDLTSSSALSRDLGGAGMSSLARLAQTDPKKAAAQALNDSALDVLKAISGVQGFRGNQTAVENVKQSLPKITDTQDTVSQKLNFIAQQMQDRESGILQTKGTRDYTNFVIRSEDQAKNAIKDYGDKNPDKRDEITKILKSINPDTGQPYTYLDAAQLEGITIPGTGGSNGLFGLGFMGL